MRKSFLYFPLVLHSCCFLLPLLLLLNYNNSADCTCPPVTTQFYCLQTSSRKLVGFVFHKKSQKVNGCRYYEASGSMPRDINIQRPSRLPSRSCQPEHVKSFILSELIIKVFKMSSPSWKIAFFLSPVFSSTSTGMNNFQTERI